MKSTQVCSTNGAVCCIQVCDPRCRRAGRARWRFLRHPSLWRISKLGRLMPAAGICAARRSLPPYARCWKDRNWRRLSACPARAFPHGARSFILSACKLLRACTCRACGFLTGVLRPRPYARISPLRLLHSSAHVVRLIAILPAQPALPCAKADAAPVRVQRMKGASHD